MGKKLLFCTNTELLRVDSDAMVYVKADGNYSSIIMADGAEYVITMQIGQIEKRIEDVIEKENQFIRIGRSLIINSEYTTLINPARSKIVLSDCKTFHHELSAPKEALKALKDYMEKEAEP